MTDRQGVKMTGALLLATSMLGTDCEVERAANSGRIGGRELEYLTGRYGDEAAELVELLDFVWKKAKVAEKGR